MKQRRNFMPRYINSKNIEYFLHKGKTKTGKDRYYFSQKSDSATDGTVPNGYEIYEAPNCQFFIRKIQEQIITDKEKKIVEDGLKKFSDLKSFKVHVKKNKIIVYTPNQDIDILADIMGRYKPVGKEDRDFIQTVIEYSSEMQFVLIDKKERLFNAERYNYRGSIDDWMEIDVMEPLDKLVREYVKHLGKESFFELY